MTGPFVMQRLARAGQVAALVVAAVGGLAACTEPTPASKKAAMPSPAAMPASQDVAMPRSVAASDAQAPADKPKAAPPPVPPPPT